MMIAPEFMDTNVLIYSYQESDPRKRREAQKLVERAIDGEIAISTQVLAEFSTTLLYKIKLPARTVEAALRAFSPIKLITIDRDMINRALEAHTTYGVRFYDGMIIAAAERGGCQRIWSEDFNAGQKYFGISVQNPFA